MIAEAAEKEGKFVNFLIAIPEFDESVKVNTPVRIALTQLSNEFSVNLTAQFVYPPGSKLTEIAGTPVSQSTQRNTLENS